MTKRSKRQPPTKAEEVAPIFRACCCGAPDDRTRLVYIWQNDKPGITPWFANCTAGQVNRYVCDLPKEDRPTILVRVKPRPELIAMADAIGEPRQ